MNDHTRSEDKGEDEKHESHDKITELIAITHKSTYGHSGIVVHLPCEIGRIYDFTKRWRPNLWQALCCHYPSRDASSSYPTISPRFWDDFTNKDLEAPAEVVRATTRSMGKASGIYKTEDMWRSAIRPKLLDVISVGMKKIINLDSTSADGMVVSQALVVGVVAAIVIEEDKNEFGDGGSNPSTQAGLSYGRFWAQTNVRAFKSSLILLSSLLP